MFTLIIGLIVTTVPIGHADDLTNPCDRNLHYYTGSFSNQYTTVSPIGSMLVVKFTPSRDADTLAGIRFYIGKSPTPFNARLFDRQQTLLSYKWVVRPSSVGWVELKIDSELRFNEDFYIAMEDITTGHDSVGGTVNIPWLGSVSDGNPSGRNYVRWADGKWLQEDDESWMIEAEMSGRYFLDIESPVLGPSQGGCYAPQTAVQISAPLVVGLGPGKRAVFVGWTGDISSTDASATVQLVKPVSHVKADYRTQYLLTIESPYNVTGGGWYDAGSEATITANPTSMEGIVGLLGARHVLGEWSGDATGSSTSVRITIDSPKTITATWREDYTSVAITAVVIATILVICVYVLSRSIRKASANRLTPAQYLAKLTSLRASGQISEEVYEKLKREYEASLGNPNQPARA